MLERVEQEPVREHHLLEQVCQVLEPRLERRVVVQLDYETEQRLKQPWDTGRDEV